MKNEFIKQYYINFEKLKERFDRGEQVYVWHITKGKVSISNIKENAPYKLFPIQIGGQDFTKDGFKYGDDIIPTIYTSNPFEHLGKETVNCLNDIVIELIEGYAIHCNTSNKNLSVEEWLNEKYPNLTFEEPKELSIENKEKFYSYAKELGIKINDAQRLMVFAKSSEIEEPFKEREMMVSDDEVKWTKVLVSGKFDNWFISKVKNGRPIGVKYAKEIEPIKEYTIEEILGRIKEIGEEMSNHLKHNKTIPFKLLKEQNEIFEIISKAENKPKAEIK